jgi:hypothetical protein
MLRIVSVRNASLSLGVLASIAGCAGFSQVTQERIQVQLAGEPARIELACERPVVRSDERVPGTWKRVTPMIVAAEPDPDTVQVGWLTVPMQDAPILISGPRPNAVLSHDIETALQRRGFLVAGEMPGEHLTLHVGMTMLTTEWVPAHWYQFSRTLRGHVVFRAALRRGADTLWNKTFEAYEEARYAYDRTSNHAKLLGEAYCRCLEQFDRALDGPEFEAAVRGAAEGT